MPIRRLRCLTDGFTVEENAIVIQNLGLPDDFTKHFLLKHKNVNPREGEDYSADDTMVMG